jgi:hypothetical protein
MGAQTSFRMRRVFKGLALTLLLAAELGFGYQQVGRWHDSRHRFRIGSAVDIGGRTLNIDCPGSGSPAVILEASRGG